jgi:hypothetical protein
MDERGPGSPDGDHRRVEASTLLLAGYFVALIAIVAALLVLPALR